MAKPKSLLLFISLCILFSAEAAPPRSLVTHLPGFDGPFPSKHYSGYINIDGNLTAGKNLFYYFVVSERNPAADPVVLWLNGGPGCSSFDGFVYEHGPFSFEEGKPKGSLPKLHLNSYTWTKVSNIIYLDSPVGVGLSYSKDLTKYRTGDQQTASDTHTFLLKWFEQFPEFLSNPFYISGESFAGIYVPTLASEVAKGIKNGEKPVINFKGYMVGNAVTDPKFDGNNALVPFAHGMALISDDIYEEARSACKGNYYSNSQKDDCNSKLLRVREVLTIVWWADLAFASPVVGVFLHVWDRGSLRLSPNGLITCVLSRWFVDFTSIWWFPSCSVAYRLAYSGFNFADLFFYWCS